jgi:hypothetical protein
MVLTTSNRVAPATYGDQHHGVRAAGDDLGKERDVVPLDNAVKTPISWATRRAT